MTSSPNFMRNTLAGRVPPRCTACAVTVHGKPIALSAPRMMPALKADTLSCPMSFGTLTYRSERGGRVSGLAWQPGSAAGRLRSLRPRRAPAAHRAVHEVVLVDDHVLVRRPVALFQRVGRAAEERAPHGAVHEAERAEQPRLAAPAALAERG